jgi:predicted ATPase with chaperone activity
MRANNGMLLIDDFGRQRMDPRELLNRWIVPLDRHVDHLSLWSGVTFEIPFELLVVMATNLKLSDLAEEAFIRRLKNKIKVEAMSKESFVEVLRRVAQDRGLTPDKEIEAYTLDQCAQHSPDGLRACYPRDVLNILCGVAAFEQRKATFDKPAIDRAMKLYFVR